MDVWGREGLSEQAASELRSERREKAGTQNAEGTVL